MNTLKFGNGEWYGKKDTILAYNDENSNYKPLPFNFSRASKATVVNKDGLIEEVGSGQPRIDYKDDSKGALLLEPSRSNLIPYSENFNSGWIKYGSPTINTSSIISPDGTLNGSKITRGSNGTPLRYSSLTSIGTQYTFSLYAKKGSVDKIRLDIGDVAEVEFTLTDEWQRFEVTQTPTNFTHIDISFGISTSGDNFYIYGAQLEQGSYDTSYIPTSGSAVTRLAENITQTTPNLSNSQEITVFIDLGARPLTGSNSTSDAIEFFFASNNRIVYNQNGSSKHRIEINTDGNSTRNYFSTTTFTTTPIKIAIAVTQSTLKIYTNRGDSWNVPIEGVADWSNLSVVKTNIIQSIGNIKINELRFYNTALTDQELIALTQV